MLGLQFENLALNSRQLIYNALNLRAEDIITENPFFQKKTQKQSGCQIDYMIQTKFNTLYVCEIKFSTKPINIDIIREVQEKIDRLKRPKFFSCRPVLIHVNGVSEEVEDLDFFSAIIDMSQYLNKNRSH